MMNSFSTGHRLLDRRLINIRLDPCVDIHKHDWAGVAQLCIDLKSAVIDKIRHPESLNIAHADIQRRRAGNRG